MSIAILNPAESYTFSKYALSFDTADILAESDVTLNNTSLQLPQQLPINPEPLRTELQENLANYLITTGDTWKFGLFQRQEKFTKISTHMQFLATLI
ncbi:hypothetical protein ABN584_04105 [Gloeocapsa sp. BRSZ]